MTYEEAMTQPDVVAIEDEIIRLSEVSAEWEQFDQLFSERELILHRYFEFTSENKILLAEANAAMSNALTQTYNRAKELQVANGVLGVAPDEEVKITASCLIDIDKSNTPVSSDRRETILYLLTDEIINPNYKSGITMGNFDEFKSASEYCMFGFPPTDSWNEGLPREETQDMHLIHAIHHLWDHCHFSWFDVIYLRNFKMNININHSKACINN